MKLKVCGLSNPIEVETCVSLNVNYCGFILNFPEKPSLIFLLIKQKNLQKLIKKIQNMSAFLLNQLKRIK